MGPTTDELKAAIATLRAHAEARGFAAAVEHLDWLTADAESSVSIELDPSMRASYDAGFVSAGVLQALGVAEQIRSATVTEVTC